MADPASDGDESPPAVQRQWRPTYRAPERSPSSSEEDAAPAPPAPAEPPADESQGSEAMAGPESAPDPQDVPSRSSEEGMRPPDDAAREEQSSPGDATEGDGPPPDDASTEVPSDAAPDGTAPSDGGSGGRAPEDGDLSPTNATTDDPLALEDASEESPGSPPEDSALGDEAEANLPPPQDSDEVREAGQQVNEEAFADDADDGSWTDQMQDRPDPPSDQNQQDGEFFTDTHRHVPGAEQVEEELQDFAYEINEGTADTDWTPSEREDRRIASMFARLVSKVAEDMSYQRAPGDEFWDPRKIMRRQIDRRPLRHCKKDYTKRRLALLVDTSPSCRDEAVFYSKIATGALLRDDIDLFLCPNGRIDARFDPEPMRFVDDDRGAEWALDGRVVLYFTDWDGADEIVEHSRDCTLYWFDNCPPSDYWESEKERHQRVRLQYRGRHFPCPNPNAFRRLVRKIRP